MSSQHQDENYLPYLLTGLGAAVSILLTGIGSATGSAHAAAFAIQNSKTYSWKAFVPIVQAGVLAIYGLIVAVFLANKLKGGNELTDSTTVMTTIDGCKNLCSGLATGFSVLASGYGMASFLKQLNSNSRSSSSSASSASGTTTQVEGREGEQRQPLLPREGSGVVNGGSKDDSRTFFIGVILSMIWLEAIGLYGFIVSLVLLYSK